VWANATYGRFKQGKKSETGTPANQKGGSVLRGREKSDGRTKARGLHRAGTGFNDPRPVIIPEFSEALADWPQAVTGFNDRQATIIPDPAGPA
ncbi:hypothetical protein, partial [Micromonospora sp. NPDC005367]|uniref:hypothetical protein n=1 Tax=Micromonospora sp. NPDC005367 TaxID=3155590 RepID=UPI00339F2CA8